MHKYAVSGMALMVSVCLVAPSSFAAKKALNDAEMDQATAKGQSTVDKGTGNQVIADLAQTHLLIELNAQQNTIAGNIVNSVGENNVAAAINAATGNGNGIDQANSIDQSKAGLVDMSQLAHSTTAHQSADYSSSDETMSLQASKTSESATSTDSLKEQQSSSLKTFGLDAKLNITKSDTATYSEQFPNGITIGGTINSSATSDSTGHSDSTASAAQNNAATGDAKSTVTSTKIITGKQDANTTVTSSGDALPVLVGSMDGGESRRHQDGGFSASVTKQHYVADLNLNLSDTKALGDAAIANGTANGDAQAYAVSAAEGVSKSKSDARLSIDLPVAKSGTSSSTFGLTGTLTINTSDAAQQSASEHDVAIHTESTSETSMASATKNTQSAHSASDSSSTDNSALNVVVGDHIKFGDGDQTTVDQTDNSITLTDNAQSGATALNILNVAGRNNVAVAWNMASANGGSIATNPFVTSGAGAGAVVSQINVIKQVN